MRESIHALRCGLFAFKTHRANGRGIGKSVLIYILACSLGFHAITVVVRKSPHQPSVALNPIISLFTRAVAENVVTDRLTDRHTYGTTTVTLAAHARRGLIMAFMRIIIPTSYLMV